MSQSRGFVDNDPSHRSILYGEEDQACSKSPSQAPEASGMDETINPSAQGYLGRQDARCGNFEADQANARRVTAEGAPTRIAAWTFLPSELTPSKVPKSYRLFVRAVILNGSVSRAGCYPRAALAPSR